MLHLKSRVELFIENKNKVKINDLMVVDCPSRQHRQASGPGEAASWFIAKP